MKNWIRRLGALAATTALVLAFSAEAAWARLPSGKSPPGQAVALAQADATTVSLTPLPASVANCATLDLYIDVNDVSNLYGVDVRLSFDPEVVEVVDLSPGNPQVTIQPVVDPNLNFHSDFVIRNQVDNFRGTIWFAANMLAPKPAASGSGHIARLRLRARSNGDPGFAFTYVKLATPGGVEIAATGVITGSLSAVVDLVPELDIIRKDVSNVQLQWEADTTSKVSAYQVYRSTLPYFYPQGTPYQTVTNPGSGTLTLDDAVLGNVTNNYFYAVRAVCAPALGGGESAASNQVGKFEFRLYETAQTDYSWIGVEFSLDGVHNSADLASHIENNSNANVSVISISKWNPVAQQLELYLNDPYEPAFSVSPRMPYQVEIDIPGVSSGSVVWAQVGRLPEIQDRIYTLYETNSTDYNWILQPLHMTSITKTSSLISSIVSQSSAPVSVVSLSVWNGPAQQFEVYFPGDTAATRFGYPYQVEVNVNTGNSVKWP